MEAEASCSVSVTLKSICLAHYHHRQFTQVERGAAGRRIRSAESTLQTQLFSEQGNITDLIACEGDVRERGTCKRIAVQELGENLLSLEEGPAYPAAAGGLTYISSPKDLRIAQDAKRSCVGC